MSGEAVFDYHFTTEDPSLTHLILIDISVIPEPYSGPATTAEGTSLQLQFMGDSSDEVMFGTQYNDFINAGAGNDAVDAGAGDDVIDGGTG